MSDNAIPPREDADATPQPHPNFFVRQWQGWLKQVLIVVVVVTVSRSMLIDWNDVPSGSMLPTIEIGDRIIVNKLAYDIRVPFTTWRIASWSQPERGQIITFWKPGDGTRMVKRVIGVPGDTVEIRQGQLYVNNQALPLSSPVQPGTPGANQPTFYEETIDDRTYRIQRNAPVGTISESMFIPARLGLPTPSVRESELLLNGQPATSEQFSQVLNQLMTAAGQANDRRALNALGGLRHAQRRTNLGPIVLGEDEFYVLGDNRDKSADSRYFIRQVDRQDITGHAFMVAWSLDDYWMPRFDRFFKSLK